MVKGATLLICGIGLGVLGCGRGTDTIVPLPNVATECSPNSAQILVGDGYLQNLCGCIGTGENTQIYPIPGNLTCHLAPSESQAVVFFNFSNTTLQHQIVPTSTGAKFAPTPYINLPNSNTPTVFAVSFPESETVYPFQDAFSKLNGQIFVPAP
jgi:hypothetical protein